MAKPKAVPKSVVCSECGLPWAEHMKGRKTDPTLDVCVRLLKAEMAKRPTSKWSQLAPLSTQGFGGTTSHQAWRVS